MIPESLSDRQKNVLACVIELNGRDVHPYTCQVAQLMNKKGNSITERQCAYDLGIIIRTKGSGCYSAKCDNNPKIWLFDEKMATNKLEFPNLNAAKQWCDDTGHSYGPLCRDMPIGVLKGDWLIAKWKNLTDEERDGLHGRITTNTDWDTGPVFITFKNVGGEQHGT